MSAGALLPAPPSLPASDLGWVAAELGLSVTLPPGVALAQLDALASLALRRNPRRAHLLVSRVLGKHLPVDPLIALDAAARLAARVTEAMPADLAGAGSLALGFAETATALGQAVAAALPNAECVLSTRRPGVHTISFSEEHSHSVAHRVLAPATLLAIPRPVVLVDDELSSGRTAVNTIRALHRQATHPAYVVASLLDLRPAPARVEFDQLAAELGVPVIAVSLLRGELHVPQDAPERVAPLVAAADGPQRLDPRWPAERFLAGWADDVRLTARHGWSATDERALQDAAQELAGRLAAELIARGAQRVLVLGTEELMYAPMRIAAALGPLLTGGVEVRYQSTTRSPVAPLDRAGYAVRCSLAFPAPDEPGRQSFVYNVRPGRPDSIGQAGDQAGDQPADHIVVVTDGGHTGPMVDALRGCAPVTEVLLRDEVSGAGGAL